MNFVVAQEFKSSLRWPSAFFNPKYDRCFCTACYGYNLSDVKNVADSSYVIPRGWVRMGLNVNEALQETENIWEKWLISFHGTRISAAESILRHSGFLQPGDVLMDGERLSTPSNHIPNQNFIFTSPTINYCSKYYCTTYIFNSNLTNSQYEVKVVFQCRQKPGSFKVRPETVGAGNQQICRYTRNDQLEYYTERRNTVVPCGLLVELVRI